MFIATVALAVPLGKYMAKVYAGTKHGWTGFSTLLKNSFSVSAALTRAREMNWKQHLVALLTINVIWFLLGMLVLMNMGWLPLNPDGNPSMTADCAFNTAISFVSNTNLKHYSGETMVSYLGQLVLQLFQFISAGAGMAAAAVVFCAMKERTSDKLGNFYNYFIKSCARILLPVSFIVAIILLFNGTPQTFAGKDTIITLQGDTVQVSRGPAASMVAIKQVGTNGGGFFGANSAHPLENPAYFTNIVEYISIILHSYGNNFRFGLLFEKEKNWHG